MYKSYNRDQINKCLHVISENKENHILCYSNASYNYML